MRLFKKLRRKSDYLTDLQMEKLQKVYLVALAAHHGQRRSTGDPYITHPVAVACILADMKMDYQTLAAGLLHDVIEDTSLDKQVIASQFGSTIADLVDGVTKLTQMAFVSRIEAQAENFRRMVLAMARDLRVIIIKLADRLHNMRTIGSLHAHKRARIAKETLEIFAPIAKRLGMRELSVELEELGFKGLFPMRYRVIKDAVKHARGNRKKMLLLIERTIEHAFNESQLSVSSIQGREKHLYSIYRKMHSKHLPFDEIMDVYAFRIIVLDVDTCYRVLGIIHRLFKPVPERFKDYIAIPKLNGYQSLHTTLFGPYGLPIEVQIRTVDMDRMATTGIAAHWLYKTGDQVSKRSQLRAEAWVKSLLEMHSDVSNPLEFIETVKVNLFPDEVYVFTPKGEIKALPSGATPIDFAYAVHTDIGNACVAVKVDRQLAPLSTPLFNGQTVAVVTSATGRPNPAWLDFVVTSKARTGIRNFLKLQQRAESIALGRQLLKKALESYSIMLRKLSRQVMDFLLKETQLGSFDDLLEEIGLGNRVAILVAQRIAVVAKTVENDIQAQPNEAMPLLIKGTEGMLISFGTCCYPLPGDPIVGVINIGKGILVHRERCPQMTKLRRHPDRFMALRWAEQAHGEFSVLIRIQLMNKRGALAELAAAIAEAKGNIEDMHVEQRDGLHYAVVFRITVNNRIHLARVLRRLRQVKCVEKIMRRFSEKR